MSRIGKKPIRIPQDVAVHLEDGFLKATGKNGELRLKILPQIRAELTLPAGRGQESPAGSERELTFFPKDNSGQTRANWGTMAALTKNALLGVSQGFSKVLELQGIGYRANLEGDTLVLNVGFTHPVRLRSPAGIKITVEKNRVTVSGIDKFLVGETAANIRKIKKPEPYKGKGIRYLGEVVRRKAGKKAAGETAVK